MADTAAALLLQNGHQDGMYELTGPQSLTKTEMVRIIEEVIGQDVRFEEQTRRRTRTCMTPVG